MNEVSEESIMSESGFTGFKDFQDGADLFVPFMQSHFYKPNNIFDFYTLVLSDVEVEYTMIDFLI